MIHACASRMTATGIVTGLSALRNAAAAISGTVWATVVSVQSRPLRVRVRSLTRGRQ
jgi:hypothetical protein